MPAPPSPDNPPSTELSGRAFFWRLVAILGLAGSSYGLMAAAHPVFGRAEIYFAESARAMLASASYVTPYYLGQPFFDKPILSYWAIVASFETLGLTHFAARLPSLLAALATAALTGYGAALLAGRRAGLAAAAVLCSSYLFGYFATLSMSDMWLTLFTSAACALLFAGSLSDRRRTLRWWLASVFLALAFLTKGPVGVVLPAASFLLYLAFTRQWGQVRLRHVLAALATVGVVAGVWFLALWRENGTRSLYAFFVVENLMRFGGASYRTDRWFGYIPMSFVVGGLPWTLLLPAVAWDALRRWREVITPSERHAATFLWCHVAVVIAFFWVSRMQLDYYILPALPAYAALAGCYLGRSVPRGETSVRAGGWVLAATLLLLGGLAGYFFWLRIGGENFWGGFLLAVWVLVAGVLMVLLLVRRRYFPAYAMVFAAVCGAGALGAQVGRPMYLRFVPVADYARAVRQSGETTALALSSDLDLWRGEFAFQAGRVPQKLNAPGELAAFLRGTGLRMAVVTDRWAAGLPEDVADRVRVVDRRPGLARGVTLATLLDSAKLQNNLTTVLLVSNDGGVLR